MSAVPNPTIEQLEQWLAQGMSGSGSIQQFQQLIVELQAQILSLQAEQVDLNAKLQDLEKIANPSKAQKDEMQSLKDQIAGNQSKLNQSNSELTMDKTNLANSESAFKQFTSESKTMSESGRTLNKQLKHATNVLNLSESKIEALYNAEQQAEQSRELASNAIANYVQLQAQYQQDAEDQLSRIQNDQKRIDDDNQKEQVLQDQLIKDSIAAAAATLLAIGTGGLLGPLAGYAIAMAVKDGEDLQAAKDDAAAASKDLDAAKAALLQDLTGLTDSNVGELVTMLDQLFGAVDKILKSFGNGQGSVGDATKALAEVLTFLQMITTKVHQLKEQDQVWMNKANAVGFEVSANKMQGLYEVMAILMAFQDFMKTFMTAVEVIADIASVAVAIASGGTLAPVMAALMVTLSATGVFQKATEALAHALSKTDAVWAQVVAEVIVTVVSVILTCSISAAVDEVLASVGRSVAQKVTIFLKALLKALLSPKTWEKIISLRGLGMGTVYFGTNNGIADLIEMFVAIGMSKGNDSKKELEKDKTFQILEIALAIFQAIIVAAVGYKTLSAGQGEKSVLEMVFGKVGMLEKLLGLSQGLLALGGAMSATGMAELGANDGAWAGLTIDAGKVQADSMAYKAMHDMMKIFEGKELEAFAALLQQDVQSLLITMRKMGESELEAARMLLETAV